MKRKKEEKFKITSEQQLKMDRAIRRKIRLEQGEYRPTVEHKTSKRDVEDRKRNTLKPTEIETKVDEELSYLDSIEDYREGLNDYLNSLGIDDIDAFED